mgnify:CR=1 FL=1
MLTWTIFPHQSSIPDGHQLHPVDYPGELCDQGGSFLIHRISRADEGAETVAAPAVAHPVCIFTEPMDALNGCGCSCSRERGGEERDREREDLGRVTAARRVGQAVLQRTFMLTHIPDHTDFYLYAYSARCTFRPNNSNGQN